MIEFALGLVLPLIALALLIVNSRRERETMLRAINLAVTEGTKERAAHRAQVDKLLTRIQAPEAASFIETSPGKQYITEDDDEEGWKAIKAQVERGMNGGA